MVDSIKRDMNNKVIASITILICSFLIGCTDKAINLSSDDLTLVNREITLAEDKTENTLILNAKQGDGMAVLKKVNFNIGTIDLEL